MKLKTITVNGDKYEIEVDNNGTFSTFANGERFENKSLSALKVKLKDIRGDLNVPCTDVTGYRLDEELDITHGIVTGVHSGNSNFIVKWDSGGTGQHRGRGLLNRLTQEEIAELNRLHRLRYESENAYSDFLDAHRFEIPATPNQTEERNT